MPDIPDIACRMFVPKQFVERRGKVRDRIRLGKSNFMGQLATDRLSIFDFVLPVEVPQKGEVLTAMDAFWFEKLHQEFNFDLAAFGAKIDGYLPPPLAGKPDLQRRTTIVRRVEMVPCEAIPRGYLTGSGWKAYKETTPNHVVCGVTLPHGLRDGDELPEPIFTATTKAEVGHDEHIDVSAVEGGIRETAMLLYKAASLIARERGIIIADTKFEFGFDSIGALVCGDERLTPDSSRFWSRAEWLASRQAEEVAPPPAFDKQFVREWGKKMGIDQLDPKKAEDVAKVHALTVPDDIVWRTSRLYRYIFFLLTGNRLEHFQTHTMGIPTRFPKVELVIASESDRPQTEAGLVGLDEVNTPYVLHAISCHRNPDALRQYAADIRPETGVIIAGAGKAAALPGVLQSWLSFYGKGHIPVIGVGFKGKTSAADFAAILSQEELPGQPVTLDEDGKAFFGPEGFKRACRAAIVKEFLAPVAIPKGAIFNLACRN